MWWGGFSEDTQVEQQYQQTYVLIPMWWGGFSETYSAGVWFGVLSLNPHVVGRFFRVKDLGEELIQIVLIPMWWGGFSERQGRRKTTYHRVLIPMWWGGFSELATVLQ